VNFIPKRETRINFHCFLMDKSKASITSLFARGVIKCFGVNGSTKIDMRLVQRIPTRYRTECIWGIILFPTPIKGLQGYSPIMDLSMCRWVLLGGPSSLFSVSSWQVLLGATLGSSLRIVDGECWMRIRGLLRRVAAAKLLCRSGSNGKQRRRGAMLTGNGPAGIRPAAEPAWSTEADEIRGSKDDGSWIRRTANLAGARRRRKTGGGAEQRRWWAMPAR
jgi:hypothetical protein